MKRYLKVALVTMGFLTASNACVILESPSKNDAAAIHSPSMGLLSAINKNNTGLEGDDLKYLKLLCDTPISLAGEKGQIKKNMLNIGATNLESFRTKILTGINDSHQAFNAEVLKQVIKFAQSRVLDKGIPYLFYSHQKVNNLTNKKNPKHSTTDQNNKTKPLTVSKIYQTSTQGIFDTVPDLDTLPKSLNVKIAMAAFLNIARTELLKAYVPFVIETIPSDSIDVETPKTTQTAPATNDGEKANDDVEVTAAPDTPSSVSNATENTESTKQEGNDEKDTKDSLTITIPMNAINTTQLLKSMAAELHDRNVFSVSEDYQTLNISTVNASPHTAKETLLHARGELTKNTWAINVLLYKSAQKEEKVKHTTEETTEATEEKLTGTS